MSQIKTFQQACKKLGITTSLPDVSMLDRASGRQVRAFYKLCIITDALNDGWKPNWNNSNQWKHNPWFYLEKTKNNPEGFSLYYVNYFCQRSIVPSRLCFKNEELVKYAVKQFRSTYKTYFLS